MYKIHTCKKTKSFNMKEFMDLMCYPITHRHRNCKTFNTPCP